jgi:hypothetical protein
MNYTLRVVKSGMGRVKSALWAQVKLRLEAQ